MPDKVGVKQWHPAVKREHGEVAVALGVKRHIGDDAHTQPLPHVIFNHLRIARGQHHPRREAAPRHRFGQRRRLFVRGDVGNQRVGREAGQPHERFFRHFMALRHDRHRRPAFRRQHEHAAQQRVVRRQIARRKPGKIGIALLHHLQNLRVRAFDDVHRQLRVFMLNRGQNLHQAVMRQRVRGGDGKLGQREHIMMLTELNNMLHRHHNPLNIGHHRLAHFGQPDQRLAVAAKDRQAEQLLGELDLLAHRRLRQMQLLRRRRHAEIRLHHRGDALQLLQLHAQNPEKPGDTMRQPYQNQRSAS